MVKAILNGRVNDMTAKEKILHVLEQELVSMGSSLWVSPITGDYIKGFEYALDVVRDCVDDEPEAIE